MTHPTDHPSALQKEPLFVSVASRKSDVDYIFYDLIRSMCLQCRRIIDTQILLRENKVYMRKRCPEHGQFEVLILGIIEVNSACNIVQSRKPETSPQGI